MKKFSLAPIALALALTGCTGSEKAPETKVQTTQAVNAVQLEASNPFSQPWTTPHGIPDFPKINTEHYLPAFKAAMAQQKQEIAAIVANTEAPTFANTIEAYEFTGNLMDRVANVFYNLTSAETSDELKAIAKEVSPLLSAHWDDLSLNADLFKRVEAVYQQKDQLNLSTSQAKLLEDSYIGFVRAGAKLNASEKAKIRELNAEIAKLTLQFGDNLLAETNAFEVVVSDKSKLSGLSQSIIDAAAATAKSRGHEGKWVFTTHRPSITPFITYADDRELRKELYLGYINRANNDNEFDNKKTLAKVASLRATKAKLMGYQSHAHYVLEDRVAKTPAAVYELLNQIWPTALAKAKVEVADMQKLVDAEGGKFKIEAWDYAYYAEKIRKARYDIDEEQTRPYFALESTLQGVFHTAEKLFGITVKERTDLPTYHDDVRTFEVYEADGTYIGLFLADHYVRPGKRGGAWMNSYRKQYNMNGVDSTPIIVNVLNYPRPTGDEPALLTFDQASTLFHEFGHALHGLLSDGTYRSQTGTSVPRDFVEFPSQVMENWMLQPEVLAVFAKHYKTGEVIPQELVDKIQAASKFNQGFATTEYMAATLLDLNWHSLEDDKIRDAASFEKDALDKLGLISEITPRYRSTYFAHIFSGGYSAGYYSYIWSDVFGSDAFSAFKENGIFDQKTAQAFRKYIFASGGSDDALTLYKKFRGKEASIEPLLKSRGLTE
ncbi:M3 family metallopeptidase [Psychrobium sp. 1_MG-2023]|uniref:M3 family metallopeptidase n=1 Tax=Psychrobium sp. 1_MG-2023 TaxID=3062624 RepID=UPI000C3347DA|nr:M3 family metallopeptidase [Psychrobium sp. 1_MG-2023]MDP2561103.1 M3 family metallopeptidase [Psychrobium sp. 1_MG-2023]PKF58391.1 peptidase M3 [Alteromonadales bacterium alter-6D02]